MRQLDVYIEIAGQEHLAGSIRGKDPSDAVFSYDSAFLDRGKAISVHLPLRKEAFSPDETRCFFEGLLPEGFSRKTVASWLRADEEDYLTILSELGKECLGAIRIEENENRKIETPRYVLLSLDEVRRLAAEGVSKSTEILVESHLSLTGASGKVGLFLAGDQWYQPFGTAPSTHILKQSHIRFRHLVENEQLVLRTAKKLGISTVESFVVHAGGSQESDILLATKRYDRDLIHSQKKIGELPCPLRLHQEDFAQALGIPGNRKYEGWGEGYLEKIFALLRSISENPMQDQLELLDLLIYDKLVGNTDNHIKNLSLLYNGDLSAARLAPAYDLVSTIIYKNTAAEMSIAIGRELRLDRISKQSFMDSDREIGLSRNLIQKEYERLQSSLAEAMREVAGEMEGEGFLAAPEMAEKILALSSTQNP